MTEINFGDLELSAPYLAMVDEMGLEADALSLALQNVVEQNYQQYDAQRRQQEAELEQLDVETS